MADGEVETMGDLAARLLKEYEPRIREAGRAHADVVDAMSRKGALVHVLLRGLARDYVQRGFRPVIALAIHEIEKSSFSEPA